MIQQFYFWIYSQKNQKLGHEEIFVHIHVHSSIICNSEGESKLCLSLEEWMNKISYPCIVEYYLSLKRSEVLIHATTWMNGGISQAGRTILHDSTHRRYLQGLTSERK
jgi:hypothetical protein